MSSARRCLAQRMAERAVAFLESLDQWQHAQAAWAWSDSAERGRWYYTPTDHGGLPLAAMQLGQQRLAHRLLASGLSEPGYVTVCAILGLENVLDQVENWATTFRRHRGRDPGLYFFRIFGDPSGTGPWSWRVGGHHVSVNHTIVDGAVVGSTPLFLGADPASAPLLGSVHRPLAGAEDVARALVQSLDRDQRTAAVLTSVAPTDVVSANRLHYGQGTGDLPLPLPEVWRGRFTGELGEQIRLVQERADLAAGITEEHLEAVRLSAEPRGISAKELGADQRQLLRALLDVYVGRAPEEIAADERARNTDGTRLDDLWFAWAGGSERGEGHYYRVQGPEVLVEYGNTQRGANHIHSVWRDASRDFGRHALQRRGQGTN